MKSFLCFLVCAGLIYASYLGYRHLKPTPDRPDVEQTFRSYEHRPDVEQTFRSYEQAAFGTLSSSTRISGNLSEQIETGYRDGHLSETEVQGYRTKARFLQRAIQDRQQYLTRFQNAQRDPMKTFDQDVKARRIKLQQQDIERQWSEKRKSLQTSYQRL